MNDFAILVLIVVILVINISNKRIIRQLRSDIALTNATLYKISKQIGLHDSNTVNIDNELKSLIREDKSVEAVNRYRLATGIGLKEAMEYIDVLSQQ